MTDTGLAGTRLSALEVASVLERLRGQAPLVHCITNVVVAGFTANVLLAAGASPAMIENDQEAAEFAGIADALLVNIGTLSGEQVRAIRAAAPAALRAGTPWVFDPVAVGPLAFRTAFATELLEHRPTVVRGNPSEVLSLAGAAGAGRGVDSTAESSSAVSTARQLARRTGGVVAVSGEVDYITDGNRLLEVHAGHPLMTKVTGVGCALGSLVAACCAVENSALVAAAAATSMLTVAAEVAAASSQGPGSFAVALLDALSSLDEKTLAVHLEGR
ncbi:MAG TPA: hydroxyethylthiazole kinase [Propionibacteriaceae bacterium]